MEDAAPDLQTDIEDAPTEVQPLMGDSDLEAVEHVAKARLALLEQIRKRVVGQQEVIDHLLTALIAGGHCLFVGVPGLAKTLLVSSVAELLDLKFSRIQFTPDLMPSDITGADILEEEAGSGRRAFRFIHGPVFANLILADEINRTPPKTQAALLQAMQEGRVTAGGTTHDLPKPFLVFATQNPIEQEGTYPLPEAQLDRFMFQVDVGYPDESDEIDIVKRFTTTDDTTLSSVLRPDEILKLQSLVLRVPVADHVVRYAVRLARCSRPGEHDAPEQVKQYLSWGAGPRASQYLVLAAKARALLDGRFAVHLDDVTSLASPVLRHRLVRNFRAEAENVATEAIIAAVVAQAKQD